MTITIEIDETTWREAVKVTALSDPSEIVRSLIARERNSAARMRLMLAGGTMPDLEGPPRERSEPNQ